MRKVPSVPLQKETIMPEDHDSGGLPVGMYSATHLDCQHQIHMCQHVLSLQKTLEHSTPCPVCKPEQTQDQDVILEQISKDGETFMAALVCLDCHNMLHETRKEVREIFDRIADAFYQGSEADLRTLLQDNERQTNAYKAMRLLLMKLKRDVVFEVPGKTEGGTQ
jgi:hypothetical protein